MGVENKNSKTASDINRGASDLDVRCLWLFCPPPILRTQPYSKTEMADSGGAYATKAKDTDFRRKWDETEFKEKAKKKDQEERERMQENEERIKQGMLSTFLCAESFHGSSIQEKGLAKLIKRIYPSPLR